MSNYKYPHYLFKVDYGGIIHCSGVKFYFREDDHRDHTKLMRLARFGSLEVLNGGLGRMEQLRCCVRTRVVHGPTEPAVMKNARIILFWGCFGNCV